MDGLGLHCSSSTKEQREEYREALRAALRAGQDVLINGGEAMDAAVAAVSYMEGQYLSLIRGS